MLIGSCLLFAISEISFSGTLYLRKNFRHPNSALSIHNPRRFQLLSAISPFAIPLTTPDLHQRRADIPVRHCFFSIRSQIPKSQQSVSEWRTDCYTSLGGCFAARCLNSGQECPPPFAYRLHCTQIRAYSRRGESGTWYLRQTMTLDPGTECYAGMRLRRRWMRRRARLWWRGFGVMAKKKLCTNTEP